MVLVLDDQTGGAADMSRVWRGVGGFFKELELELARVGRRGILFIGVPGVCLVVVVDIHYELEASHDGRVVTLDLEVRYQVSNTQPGWSASTNREEVAVDMETNIKSGSGSGTGVHARLLLLQAQCVCMWERGSKAARQAGQTDRYEGYRVTTAARTDRLMTCAVRGKGRVDRQVGLDGGNGLGWDGNGKQASTRCWGRRLRGTIQIPDEAGDRVCLHGPRCPDRERKHPGVPAGPRQNVDCYIERWLSKGREKGTC
jgi:hypothetical protein